MYESDSDMPESFEIHILLTIERHLQYTTDTSSYMRLLLS